MTNQELFNIVWERAKDPRQAVDGLGGRCMYRAPNGLKCFIGAAIPDDKYRPAMDTAMGNSEVFDEIGIEDHTFAYRVQAVHDTREKEEWNRILKDIALRYGLRVPN